MRILAFDTSTEFLSVCLLDSGATILRTLSGPLRHGANLAPLIAEVLQESGVAEISQVDLVACPEGPGSFTGLRIGYATAKGLVAALQGHLPVVSVPTLELHGWRRRSFPGAVMPILDARKGRFYTALFQNGRRLTEDLDYSAPELLSLLPQALPGRSPVLLTGYHAHLVQERLGSGLPEGWTIDAQGRAPTACDLAQRALDLHREGKTLSQAAGPRYVRRSDAELTRGKSRESR